MHSNRINLVCSKQYTKFTAIKRCRKVTKLSTILNRYKLNTIPATNGGNYCFHLSQHYNTKIYVALCSVQCCQCQYMINELGPFLLFARHWKFSVFIRKMGQYLGFWVVYCISLLLYWRAKYYVLVGKRVKYLYIDRNIPNSTLVKWTTSSDS